jgi:hypothetical protein
MANTITLSTDMYTIYIHDSNSKLIFSQNLSGYGAVIYLDSNNELAGQVPIADITGSTTIKSVTGWQWTASYNASTKTLSFIGDEDVTTDVDQVDFSIDQNNGVQVKRSGNNLIFIAGSV